MINKRWITLPVVYSRTFASKAVFWAILNELEFVWMNLSLTVLYNRWTRENISFRLSVFSKFSARAIAFLAFWLPKKLRLWANNKNHYVCPFQKVSRKSWKILRVYMVLGDAVSKLTFVWILNHISRSITWSLFTLIASYLVKLQISTWSYILVVSVYRFIKIGNSPQFPAEFRNGQLVLWERRVANHVLVFSICAPSKLRVVFVCKAFCIIHTYKLYSRPKRAFQRIQKKKKKNTKWQHN